MFSKSMNQVVKDVLSFDRSQCQFGSQPSNILGGEAWQSTELKTSLFLCCVYENKEENYGDNNSEYLETELSPLDDLRQKFHQEN